MVPGSTRNWIAVNAVQQSSLNTNKNMTTLHLRKSIGQSPLPLGSPSHSAGARLLCAFADSSSTGSPAPDGGYPNGNTAEGDSALSSLTTDAQSTYEPYSFTTFAGLPPGSADGTGSAARFNSPAGVARR